jgi:hypothetical protein
LLTSKKIKNQNSANANVNANASVSGYNKPGSYAVVKSCGWLAKPVAGMWPAQAGQKPATPEASHAGSLQLRCSGAPLAWRSQPAQSYVF